jgi:hypothetical protein
MGIVFLVHSDAVHEYIERYDDVGDCEDTDWEPEH